PRAWIVHMAADGDARLVDLEYIGRDRGRTRRGRNDFQPLRRRPDGRSAESPVGGLAGAEETALARSPRDLERATEIRLLDDRHPAAGARHPDMPGRLRKAAAPVARKAARDRHH